MKNNRDNTRFQKENKNGNTKFQKENYKDRGKKERVPFTSKRDVETKSVEREIREDLIEGRNAVIEALKGETTIEQIFLAKGDLEGSISIVLAKAKEKNIIVKEVDRKKLDAMSQTGSHQGVIAVTTPYNYFEVEDILNHAKAKGEAPFIIILDEIQDSHNLGAIIRTAEACGVHGIIIPKRRNIGVNTVVYKACAGAIEYVKVSRVTNINNTIDKLKGLGIWIYGADMDGKKYCFDVNFNGGCALVIGSEGKGISKLTRDKCDLIVKIPMVGRISSLNASVAGSILMYEVMRQNIVSKKSVGQ